MRLPPLGEWYDDLLTLDSWINERTKGQQALSLLSAKLQEREPKIRERLEYLAKKRGITSDELWQQIIHGTANKVSQAESEE